MSVISNNVIFHLTISSDPVFYRWHSYVDDIFQLHKAKLPPYTVAQLEFSRITASNLSVNCKSRAVNTLHTCWEQSDIDFSHGLDFVLSKGSVYARVTHLTHEPFNYTINVKNDGDICEGMVRIFLLPETNELGNMLGFNELRLLAIEMDRFVAKRGLQRKR
jgi:tyrosinase